jgi:hypothetical protein
MTTIFTGTLVATGQQGVLSTGKSVWLNSQFVHEMTTTSYVDTTGATQTGTLVLYKAGDGTELLNLIFSDSLGDLLDSMNTQPSSGTVPLNVWEMQYAATEASLNYSYLYVDTTKIWWIEDFVGTGVAPTDSITTIYNNTLDNRFNYYTKQTSSVIASEINN